ncbi:MAG: hypothetical protein NTW97_00505 [Candidatus Krumholzibacteria bacterium]|nr:hypothetical protein [Candidatus Krumholzibacteria bacterium]
MKRGSFLVLSVLCLSIAAFLIAASPVLASGPQIGYIGLFKDATHDVSWPANSGNTVCPSQYGQFQCWIWCLPSVHGLQAAEFAVSFPSTVVVLATVQNPGTAGRLCCGSLVEGISVAFGEGLCQMDWVWLFQLSMMQLGSPEVPAKIEIVPSPGVWPLPAYQFASCEPGNPIEPCINLTPLYICWTPNPGPLGVRETSWGAIKSLF